MTNINNQKLENTNIIAINSSKITTLMIDTMRMITIKTTTNHTVSCPHNSQPHPAPKKSWNSWHCCSHLLLLHAC